MKISKDLNLVIERPQEDGTVLRVHSMPIPLSVYEDNALMIGEAMVRSYSSGMTPQAIARVVAPTMRDIARGAARARGVHDNAPTDYDRLMAEIRRRTMILVPRAGGYESLLMDEAIARDIFDEEDVSEINGLTLFFSAAYRFHGKGTRMDVVKPAALLWNGFVTSSNSTEYAASLPTSTQPASSGEKAPSSNGAVPHGAVVATETDASGASRAVSLPS